MTVYLDTSSLIKLYVEEVGSSDVRDLVSDADIVATSLVAYPEARAALARLRRSGDLSARDFARAKRTFEDEWSAFLALEVTTAISHEAGTLAEQYALRGFDALHLASFAAVARRAGAAATRFSSFDDHLNQAWRRLARRLERST